MKLLILLFTLASGESSHVVLDDELCRLVPLSIAEGLPVTVSLLDGRELEIVSAVCVDPEGES